jgi:hypothetical protein
VLTILISQDIINTKLFSSDATVSTVLCKLQKKALGGGHI